MLWFKVYADLKDHPKRWKFEDYAETEHGMHYLILFFSYICKYAEDGDIGHLTHKEVARACEWRGDAEKFWDALCSAGFIEMTKSGPIVHDWYEENGRFIRENQAKKDPRATRGKPVGNPRATRATVQDNTVQDITKEPMNQPSAATPPALGFDPVAIAVEAMQAEGATILNREPRTIAVLRAQAKKLGEQRFRDAASYYAKDKFFKERGLTLKGLLDNLDKCANAAQATKPVYKPIREGEDVF